MTDELGCYDCNRPYAKGPDLLIEQAAWLKIAPSPDGGGVLCPNCIHDRLVAAGFADGTVLAEFKSGPMASDDLITDLKRDTRARRQRAPAMTDEELRGKVARAIWRKFDRFPAHGGLVNQNDCLDQADRAIALCREHYGGEVERLRRERDEAVEALEPFADEADEWEDMGNTRPIYSLPMYDGESGPVVGDFRRARTVCRTLRKEEGDD